MKIRTDELKVGDVIYPIGYGQQPDSCAVVDEIMPVMYTVEELKPVRPVLASIYIQKLNKTFQIKLTDDEVYNVIYRKNEDKTEENKQ